MTETSSFSELFNARYQEIMDVLEGNKEFDTINLDTTEDSYEVDQRYIYDLFEKLKIKVLNLDLTDEIRAQLVPGEEIKDKARNIDGKRWYDGTFYTCKQCPVSEYGAMSFRKHLRNAHSVESKLLSEYRNFASHYQEITYTCLICEKKVDHEFKSIYDHLKRTHSLSMGEYEKDYEKKAKKNVIKNISSRSENKKKRNNSDMSGDRMEEDIIEKLVPQRSVQSQQKTLYYCPLLEPIHRKTNCSFYTTKEGFKNGDAAGHLCLVHKIRKQDMKPGEFKFKKFKSEM